MKLDEYMPFFGDRFFRACIGRNDAFTVAYLRACWHYWSVGHCRGLKNDDDFLRSVCDAHRARLPDWQKMKADIFDEEGGEFFHLEEGLWHQKFARGTYAILMKKHAAASERANRRWEKNR